MQTITPPVPKYKHLRFKTDISFKVFLKETSTIKILFEDQGQDVLTMWIDDRGEVLHSDLQSTIWTGKFIKTETLIQGLPVEIYMPEFSGWRKMEKLKVENLIELSK